MRILLTKKEQPQPGHRTGISARCVRCTCGVIDSIMKDIKANTSRQILINTFAQQEQAFQFCCTRRTGLLTIKLEYTLRFDYKLPTHSSQIQ